MFTKNLSLALLSMVMVGSTSYAKHYPDHRKDHPRQNEVNKRLDNQTNRAERQEKNGKITEGQEEKIERQDKAIYNQEQRMKERNGGDYLTKGQQEKLNKEENAVNREDRKFVKEDKAAPQGGSAAPAPATQPGN